MRRRIVATLTPLLLQLFVAPNAYALLERAGPTSTVNGYPEWYQDKTGLILDFCSPTVQAELDGGYCLLLPPIPASAPEVFPTNFSDEHFYWAAGSDVAGIKLIMAVEGAFATGPVIAGDQVVFGRIRVQGTANVSGTYTVYHPYGVWVFPDVVAGGKLFFTEDIGITCPPGAFDCALSTSIGPFLLASNAPGGAELPPVTLQASGRKYIADPARNGPVTGSPLPQFTASIGGLLDGVADAASPLVRNHNIYRIEVQTNPTTTVLLGETYDFTLMGRVYENTAAGRISVERATYSRSAAASNQLDVFATVLPTVQGRIPPALAPPPVQPELVYYEAPCGIDAATGKLKRPVDPVTGVFLPAHLMPAPAAPWKHRVGQSAPGVIPPAVCVEQLNALGVFHQAPVTDQVFITEAQFDPNTLLFCVDGYSSDQLIPPVLSVGTYGVIDPLTGMFGTQVAAPPNKITVYSSAGGVNQRLVNTLYFNAPVSTIPVANADAVTTSEDVAPAPIAVLSNDTVAGGPVPAGALVSILSPPLLGTASVNPDGTIGFVPRLNANGSDVFTYTVTSGGFVSSPAAVSITILPVNDLPVAVNDSFNAVAGTIANPLNVFANDSDPDGATDLFSAVNLTLVSAPAGAAPTLAGGAGGIVTLVAPVAGTYTFTYQAQDLASGLSNVATVTVNAFGAETIAVAKAQFTVRQLRWVVAGTVAPANGQALTIAYANGPNAGFVIGTAVANAAGNWTFDVLGATGLYDPRIAYAGTAGTVTEVVVTGPAGGAAIATFRIK